MREIENERDREGERERERESDAAVGREGGRRVVRRKEEIE